MPFFQPYPSRRTFVSSLAAGLALPALGRPLGVRRQEPAWIPSEDFLEGLPRLLELASVPGIAMAVVEDGAVAWERVLGVANVETGAAVSDRSVFPAASLGKPVFGYVVMKLVEEGLLDLDRSLVDILRPDDSSTDPRLDRITPRHVLSHTTGLPNWRRRAGEPLVPGFDPGERFQYSGEGFFWLQRVVESLTGRGIDLVMRDRLFAPADMARATYAWSAGHRRDMVWGHERRGALARQYNREIADPLLGRAEAWGKPMTEWTAAEVFRAMEENQSPLPRLPNFAIPNVAGSLILTAGDYARFLGLMMSEPQAAPWKLTDASRSAMLSPVVNLNRALSWGLGWGLESTVGGRLFWHWGDNGPFRAFTVGDPGRRRALVVMTNGEAGPNVYQRVVADATGLDLAAFLWV